MPPMPRGHGKISQETVDGIIQRITAGNSLQASCHGVGVNDGTVRRWRERGQAEIDRLEANPEASPLTTEYLYRALAAGVTRAMADAEAGRVVRILEAGRPHEVTTRIETLRHFKIRTVDGEGRPVDVIESRTDVRTETRTEFDWRADAWWLEHARPQFWGRSNVPSAATDDERAPDVGADLGERAARLVDELRQRREARETAVGE